MLTAQADVLRDEGEAYARLLEQAGVPATLSRYELPAEIRIVDELPRTPSAKVDLAAIASLFAGA